MAVHLVPLYTRIPFSLLQLSTRGVYQLALTDSVLQLRTRGTRIAVDVSVSDDSGPRAARYMAQQCRAYPPLKPLVGPRGPGGRIGVVVVMHMLVLVLVLVMLKCTRGSARHTTFASLPRKDMHRFHIADVRHARCSCSGAPSAAMLLSRASCLPCCDPATKPPLCPTAAPRCWCSRRTSRHAA